MNIFDLENKDYRIKKLIYQSTHRGCKELDIILGNFASTLVNYNNNLVFNLLTLSDDLLNSYEMLCNENEWDIYSWISEESAIPDKFQEIINKIKVFNSNIFKNQKYL